jgi:hypothetical protein
MLARKILSLLAAAAVTLHAAEPAFRTDGGDEKLPWFELKAGEFPPEGSAHAIAGELIALDHVNRTGVLRPDRTDAQRRGDWDIPLAFTLLPYGSLSYHGAPAELRDIPIGTHLHGQFYIDEQAPKDPKAKPGDRKPSVDGEFSRVLRLEDDFSHSARLQHAWRVDAIDLEKNTFTVMGITAGKEDAKPTIFQLTPATRVWKGRGIGTLADLATGQSVIINITVATLKGPGRALDIWLDAESREVAASLQRETHRQFIREHGLAGMIDAVDNEQGIVSVTLFAGFDPKLMDDFPTSASLAASAKAPPFVPGPGLVDPIAVTGAVAEDNLRTWDQINDRKAGPLIEVQSIAAGPGNSGVRVRFKPAVLLEGFRPKRIIRIWCSKWKVDDLPREERLYK